MRSFFCHRIILFYLLFIISIIGSGETSTPSTALKKLGLEKIENEYTPERIKYLISVWDSLNTHFHNSIYEKLPVEKWQFLLEDKLAFTKKVQDSNLYFNIAYRLSFVYHTQSKFKEGIQILEYLYNNKKKLDKKQYASVLIKLEEEYRAFHQIDKVIKIRNERIENGFIKTFWEIYKECGLYYEAINDFKLFEPIPANPSRQRLMYFMQLSTLYFDAQLLDSAEKYAKIGIREVEIYLDEINAKKIVDKGNFIYWKGWFSELIAKCLIEKKYYKEAKSLLDYSLSVSTGSYRLGGLLYKSVCYLNLGEIRKTKECLDSVAIIMSNRELGGALLTYFKTKSDYFKITRQYDSSLFYLQSFNEKKNLMTDNILKNQSALLLGSLEIDKRRKELLLTQKELTEEKLTTNTQRVQLLYSIVGLIVLGVITTLLFLIYRQKAKSKRLIEEKNLQLNDYAEKNLIKSKHNEQLVKELHHRVKNNLQNIYSLLNIQKRRIEDANIVEFISSIQNRINSMAIIHESLYYEENIEAIDFEKYLRNLIGHLQLSYQKEGEKLAIEYHIEATQVKLEKIILIGLIINEAVSNAFKYVASAHQKHTLIITFQKNNANCILRIQDDGPGFNIQNIHEKNLGLKLINIMCQQLDAVYDLNTMDGTQHTITFSI